MAKITEDFKPLANWLMALAVLDVDNEADPASVVFIARVIETFGGGEVGNAHPIIPQSGQVKG